VYDQTIDELQKALDRPRLAYREKKQALKNLSEASRSLEKNFSPNPEGMEKLIRKEHDEAYLYGGRTAFGKSKPPKASRKSRKKNSGHDRQLKLF